MTLIHGAGVVWPALESRHVFAAVGGKAAEAVEELELVAAALHARARSAAARVRERAGGNCRRRRTAVELLRQGCRAGRPAPRAPPTTAAPASPAEIRSARSTNTAPCATRRRCRRAAATGWCAPASPARSAGPAHRRRALVQDHQIDRELLHPPVFVCPQQLADDAEVLDVVDPQQDDRQVAGNAVRPQRRCVRRAAANRVRGRPQRRHRRRGCGRRAAETGSLRRRRCRGDAAAPAPVSRPGSPRARRRWRRDACRPGRAPRRATPRPRPEGRRTRRARRDAHAAAQAKIGSSTVPAVFERGRPSSTATGSRISRPRPRKRARSVSNSAVADDLAFHHRKMRRPDFRLVWRAAPARGQERAELRQGTRSARTAWRTPDAPRRRPAAPARARHRR